METSAPQTTRRPISLKKKLAFSCVALLFALSAFEVTARLVSTDQTSERFRQIQQIVVFLGTQESDLMLDFDPDRFWKLKPNVEINDPANRLWQGIVSNSLGVRNEEFELEKTEGVTRVVCFGDSSTFGIGTPVEETWPAQLETLLNEHPDNPPSQVINAGVPGYTSHQGLKHMQQEIDRLQPDVVIASYANNDFWHWDNMTDLDQAARFNQQSFGRLLRKSRAVQVVDSWLSKEPGSAQDSDWAKTTSLRYFSEQPNGVPRVPLDHFENNLIEMSKLCAARKIRLVYMLWPDQPQAAGHWSDRSQRMIDQNTQTADRPQNGNQSNTPYVRIEYQKVIKNVAKDRGHGIADVVSQFQRNRSWSVRTYIPNDIVHVNKSGNRLAAIAAEAAVLSEP
jgi:hypothetical protein